ncbi:MAG: EamA/RhaT family transporter, partial [Mesorhizobium sp.]
MSALPRQDESATPPAAILCMLSVYVFFTFLDTSSKYLVMA